jgi:hypothetical protein
MRSAIGGLFGGLVGGIGGGTASIFLGIGVKMHDPIFAASLWVATLTLAYASARGLFGRHARTHDQEVCALAEALAAQARESIAAAQRDRALPPGQAL